MPNRPMEGQDPKDGGWRWFRRQPPVALTQQDIDATIEDSDHTRELRRRILLRAVLVGVVTGCVAVAFRATLYWVEESRTGFLSRFEGLERFAIATFFATLCVTVSLWLVRSFSPASAGSGIPQLKAVLRNLREMNWFSLLLVKFIGGVLAIGGGLGLGREGPTVQMGGAVGKMIGGFLGVTQAERFILMAAGGGAGLAAAFNAPLSGLVFVLEEIQRAFTSRVFFAALLASATADTISRIVLGQEPILDIERLPIPPLAILPLFFALGIGAGIFGAFFNRALLGSMDAFDKIKKLPVLVPGIITGLAVGAVATIDTNLIGGGHALTEQALAGGIALGSVALFFLVRFALTLISYGSGAPAGIFAPLLVLGALGGLGLGLVAQTIFPAAVTNPEVFAVAGMGALFSSVVRAPLTGIVLIFEMTGEHYLMLPLLVACLTSYVIADYLGSRPIYASLMARALENRQQEIQEMEKSGKA